MKIAIIGTAGRDKAIPMTLETWKWMVSQTIALMPMDRPVHLVSGGAAWADHLAVRLFLDGHASGLSLHLPAPFDINGYFVGERGTAGGAANYYHLKFSFATGINSRGELLEAVEQPGCNGTMQPASPGYKGMFARNKLIAQELDPSTDRLLAFTFGQGDEPADGGTKNTWDQFHGNKRHICIPVFNR